MSNIAAALKSEIARVARREIRGEIEALHKASTAYRREVATLKKRIAALEKQLATSVGKHLRPRPHVGGASAKDEPQLRFSATRFAAQRKKTGLSAANYAKILGVSALSVYKWERGLARPRKAQLQAIAAARSLGKREAAARLESLQEAALTA